MVINPCGNNNNFYCNVEAGNVQEVSITIVKNSASILTTLVTKVKPIGLAFDSYNCSYRRVYLGAYINTPPETRPIFYVAAVPNSNNHWTAANSRQYGSSPSSNGRWVITSSR